MLEQQGLLLGPWERPGGPADPAARAVLDPATRARLGVARWRSPPFWPWLRWLVRQRLQVYETDDESLLCTVHAPWLLARAWEVFDADDRRVAVLRGTDLRNGFGRRLAVLRRGDGQPWRFLGPDGVELGELAADGDEAVLKFAAAVENEPFAKMALLGAALAVACESAGAAGQ